MIKLDDFYERKDQTKVNIEGEEMFLMHRDEYLGQEIKIFENFGKTQGKVVVTYGAEVTVYEKYNIHERPTGAWTPEKRREVFEHGEDILAREAAGKSFDEIYALLPHEYDMCYIPLGHPLSETHPTVDFSGNIIRQRDWFDKWYTEDLEVDMAYKPAAVYGELGEAKPYQSFLDGIYPILYNVHETEELILESCYFLESGDIRNSNCIYTRNVVFSKAENKIINQRHMRIAQRKIVDAAKEDVYLPCEIFHDAFLNMLDYCLDFRERNAKVSLPEKKLEKSYIGTLYTLDGLLSGERTRYGHRNYGTNNHDNFPPNIIASIMTYAINGQSTKAARLVEFFLSYCVDRRGRILYRQGYWQTYGFSASEIGTILWVINRYEKVMEPAGFIKHYIGKIRALANFLCSKVVTPEELPGISVIRTCAEADTNERIHDYLQNTLWGIRGLEAAVELMGKHGGEYSAYLDEVKVLRRSVDKICSTLKKDTRFGELVPFRLDYTPLPLNLSNCKLSTAYPVTEEEYEAYRKGGNGDVRNDSKEKLEQDPAENIYANYRYYPEILSSCILDKKYEDAMLKMRETLGGELMGMTRFGHGTDDWPAYNMALNFLERGRHEKFRNLLFAHAAHHGLIDFHIYYEQVAMNAKKEFVIRDSCIPSIVLNNLMINMMFAYETIDGGEIHLMKGIPADWVGKKAFSCEGVCAGNGSYNIEATDKYIKVSSTSNREALLFLNGFERNRIVDIARKNGLDLRGNALRIPNPHKGIKISL